MHKIIFILLLIFANSQNVKSSYPNYNIADIPSKDWAISNCYHGKCITNDKCLCNSEYAQFPAESPDGTYCNYQRQSQLKIFLIEFFFSFGIGHIAAGNIGYGLFKMFLPVMTCIFLCCGGAFGGNNVKVAMGVMGIGMFCLIAFIIMQIYDICVILFGSYLDGNGVSLSQSF